MLSIILRAILMFLVANMVVRLVRGLFAGGRGSLPSAPPPPGPAPPEIDPRDVIDANYREVKNDSSP